MNDRIVFPSGTQASEEIQGLVDSFLRTFSPYELQAGGKLHVFVDQKSGAYYLTCHLESRSLVAYCDTKATLDPSDDEDEIYKLNREITEDAAAFIAMEKDALAGRSFEDIVLEYDVSYRDAKPLKVYGGQHRLKAITSAEAQRGTVLHGIRVYFGLTREQKVEVATINTPPWRFQMTSLTE
jgi:hypothetical protein